MVGDDQDVYRVKIVRRSWRVNPDYKPGVYDPDNNPRARYDGPEATSFLGPYNTLAAAKGQLTSNACGYGGGFREGVVSAQIQKAFTTWEDVQ
jgi:hypothetical protein